MNGYSVEWTPAAENELADIWMNAADRQAVTRAEAEIQAQLRADPLNSGTDVSEGLRRLIVPRRSASTSEDRCMVPAALRPSRSGALAEQERPAPRDARRKPLPDLAGTIRQPGLPHGPTGKRLLLQRSERMTRGAMPTALGGHAGF